MILSKIKFHPLFFITIFISLITGHFNEVKDFTVIIIIHELGHIISAMIFKWKIDKVIILPFGGLTKFNTTINKPIIENLIVSISGPLLQIIFYLIFKPYLNKEINTFILLFNLLPIFPLDGFKILKNIVYLFIPFKSANKILLLLSYIISFILLILYHNLIIYMVIFLLIIRNIQEYYKQNIIFNKFLLERILYDFNYKKVKKINKIEKMMYNQQHLFIYKNIIIKEKEYLNKMFDKSYFLW